MVVLISGPFVSINMGIRLETLAETVSTDTAVTDTVAPEEVAVNEGEAVVTDTSEAEDLTAPTAGSDDENQSKN